MGWAGSVEVVGISAFACFVECIERAATIPTWGRRAARRAALETELLKTESDMVVEVRDRELLTVLNDEEDQFKAGSSHWVHPGTAGAWSRRPAERRDTVPRSGQWPTRAYQFPAKTLGGCTLAHTFCPSCPLRVLKDLYVTPLSPSLPRRRSQHLLPHLGRGWLYGLHESRCLAGPRLALKATTGGTSGGEAFSDNVEYGHFLLELTLAFRCTLLLPLASSRRPE